MNTETRYEGDEFFIGSKHRIAEVGDWDYSWSLYAVFEDGGRLFSTTDSGCSCYGPYDSPDLLDWKPLDNIHEAIREARTWSGADNKDIEDFVSKLTDWRPSAAVSGPVNTTP